ncbi:hypothetical protein PGQ11_000611 [Apiospora arundinis]
MSQPLPDDEEWASPGGRGSQESYAFSTQAYSQRMPYSTHWNDIEYIREEPTQLDTSIEENGPQEKHQLDEPAASMGATSTGASSRLGNLIPRPQLVDPQQEVNDTFSFAHHDLRKPSKQRQPDRNLSSAAVIAGGSDQSNSPVGAKRISFPPPKASSPVGTRDSPIKKVSPVNDKETELLAPISSSAPTQHNSSANIRGQHKVAQKNLHMYQNQEPRGASSPGHLRNNGTGSQDKVIQSTHKNERESSQTAHISDYPEPADAKQRRRRSESSNTVKSSLAPVEQPVPIESVERDIPVSTGAPVFSPMKRDMDKQSSKGSEDESPADSTPTRTMVKPRQPVDDKGKSNVGLPMQAIITSQAPNFQPLEPSGRAQIAANSHEGRRYSAVTTNEGPGDMAFSQGHRQTPRPRHSPTDRGFHQAPQARLGRRYPATPGITRPIRKEPVQQPPCRPLSSDSNVSKRRAPQPKSSPADHSQKLDNQFERLTHDWNTYFTSLGVYRTETEAKRAALKEHIKTQEEDIEEYREHIHTQSQLIERTTAERDQWAAQAEEERQRASSYSSKVQKLQTKCQEFKTQLNAATEEHQNLYRRNRESIVTAQKEQEARSEHIRQENEKIRADIQSSVTKVSKEAQDQIAKLNEETSILRVQLDERQKEISNEKDIAQEYSNACIPE